MCVSGFAMKCHRHCEMKVSGSDTWLRGNGWVDNVQYKKASVSVDEWLKLYVLRFSPLFFCIYLLSYLSLFPRSDNSTFFRPNDPVFGQLRGCLNTSALLTQHTLAYFAMRCFILTYTAQHLLALFLFFTYICTFIWIVTYIIFSLCAAVNSGRM